MAKVTQKLIGVNRSVSTFKSLLNKFEPPNQLSNSYATIRSEIENQNEKINELQKKIEIKSGSTDPGELKALQEKLEVKKTDLRALVQKAMLEQRKNQKHNWDPLAVNIKEDF